MENAISLMKTRVLLVILLCGPIAQGQTQPPSKYNAITDRLNRMEPAPIGLLDMTALGHGANYIFIDPIFGSLITHATDGVFPDTSCGGSGCLAGQDSGESNPWEKNSDMFVVYNSGQGLFPLNWDKTTHWFSRVGSPSNPSGGFYLVSNPPMWHTSWSYRQAKVLWGLNGYSVVSADFSSINSSSMQSSLPVTNRADLAAIYTTITGQAIPYASYYTGYITLAGESVTDDIYATTYNGSGQDNFKWVIWHNVTTGQYKVLDLLNSPNMRVWNSSTSSWTDTGVSSSGWSGVHNCRMAKDGRYVNITKSPATATNLFVWDTQTNSVSVVNSALGTRGGHRVSGYGYMLNQDDSGLGTHLWIMRPYSNLNSMTFVPVCSPWNVCSTPQYSPYNINAGRDTHLSWANARNGLNLPFLADYIRCGAVDSGNPWQFLDNELVAATTDGTDTIWRFAHTHRGANLCAVSYAAIGNISPDGKYALFASDWNATLSGRIDTFIVTLPLIGGITGGARTQEQQANVGGL